MKENPDPGRSRNMVFAYELAVYGLATSVMSSFNVLGPKPPRFIYCADDPRLKIKMVGYFPTKTKRGCFCKFSASFSPLMP